MADGSFFSRTLCNVCFSPIVMPSKDGSGGAPESQAVRSVKSPPPLLVLLSRSALHSQRARRYSPLPCQKGFPVVGVLCFFFSVDTWREMSWHPHTGRRGKYHTYIHVYGCIRSNSKKRMFCSCRQTFVRGVERRLYPYR